MIRIFDNADSLLENAARKIISAAREAVDKRGRFVIALSGGHSPRPLYRLLAGQPYSDQIPWKHTIVLWSDERYVPIDDKRSNAGTALELLLKHVPIPDDQILPMYIQGVIPEDAANRYQAALVNLFKTGLPSLDLTLLGCGKDGHTASLFPGSSLIKEKEALVAAVKKEGDVPRITMTPPLINQSRRIIFIVYGSEKAEAVEKVLEGSGEAEELPARAIEPLKGEIHWLLDQQAASNLMKVGSD